MVYFVNWLWVVSIVYMVTASQDSMLKCILVIKPHLTSLPKLDLLKTNLIKTRLIWSNSCRKKGLNERSIRLSISSNKLNNSYCNSLYPSLNYKFWITFPSASSSELSKNSIFYTKMLLNVFECKQLKHPAEIPLLRCFQCKYYLLTYSQLKQPLSIHFQFKCPLLKYSQFKYPLLVDFTRCCTRKLEDLSVNMS